MKPPRRIALALASAFVAAALPALAVDPTATPGIDKSLERQEQRIDRGVEGGQLTPREANRLDRRRDKVEADRTTAQADGVATPAERRALQRELERNSSAIARQRRDRQHDYDQDGRTDRPRR